MKRVMTLPKHSLELSSLFSQKWFWAWVFFPIFALAASFILMFLPYPIFLVIGQGLALSYNKQAQNKSYWAINALNILVVLLICSQDSAINWTPEWMFALYYFFQMLNEFVWVRLFKGWHWGYWSAANLLALAIWIGAVAIFNSTADIDKNDALFVIIPITGAISNFVTGLGIHCATQPR